MPKYLADRISFSGKEYRVIADTHADETEVWGSDLAWEFKNRAAAYSYLAEAYKTAQDLRNIAPGQEIVLTMADGQQKRVNVLSNDQMQISFTDATGKQYQVPHMQPGVQPRIMPTKNPNSQSSGDNAEGGENTMIGPGTGTTMARRTLSKRQAESFPHRHPQNCKHDGQYLQRKDPSDPEKACPQCGMVYEAAVTTEEVIPSAPGSLLQRVAPTWSCPRCPRRNPDRWPSCPCGARKPAPVQALSKRHAETFNPFNEAPKFPGGKPEYKQRPYRCMNCGNEQMIGTNHEGRVIEYCQNCSWKPSFGKAEYAVPFNGRTYRPFEYAGPTERTVLQRRNAGCDSDYFVEGDYCSHCEDLKKKKKALSKKAQYQWAVGDQVEFQHPRLGPVPGIIVRDDGNGQYVIRQGQEMLAVPSNAIKSPIYNARRKIAQPIPPSGPPGQSVPPSSPPMSTQQKGPQQAPAGDQAQPEDVAGQNRALSRHEIITEAEILIRNALHKGIRIGTWDLVEYMKQNYSNPPEELYEGATKAWEKVQWEEQEAFEVSKGPGPSQQKHPGDEAQEAPTSVEDVANQPRTGPTQVKV